MAFLGEPKGGIPPAGSFLTPSFFGWEGSGPLRKWAFQKTQNTYCNLSNLEDLVVPGFDFDTNANALPVFVLT